jgi:hypothetical protein
MGMRKSIEFTRYFGRLLVPEINGGGGGNNTITAVIHRRRVFFVQNSDIPLHVYINNTKKGKNQL